MRLVHTEYGIDIEVNENNISVLYIENCKVFSSLVQELMDQKNGEKGNFVLSENEKIINFVKETEIIINPFILDCNEKRIQQKLYQEIYDQAISEYFPDATKLNAEIVSFLEKIILNIPYDITFNIEENIQGILKTYSVRIEQQNDSLLEKVINYLRILVRLCRIKNIFFINLKTYLDNEELEKLYEFAAYEKIQIFLIENHVHEKILSEKVCILDQDLCIIHYE